MNTQTTVTFIGHATVLIETPGGKRIIIDPWITGNPAAPKSFQTGDSLGKLDVILITHFHNDHFGDAIAVAQANPDAPVVAIVEITDWIETKSVSNTVGMNKGGTVHIAGIAITMTHADHSSSLVEDDGKVIYGGEPVGYVLELEDGTVIYNSGDTALFGDMALIREFHAPDLAILPIGDHFTMDPRQAAYAARLLGVKHVLPVHYGTFPILTGTPDMMRAYLGDTPDVLVHALAPGETLTL